MLSVEGIYQNGELVLKEKVESNQPIKVIVTFLENETVTFANNNLLGLFGHEVELIDNINESAMQAREKDSLRRFDG